MNTTQVTLTRSTINLFATNQRIQELKNAHEYLSSRKFKCSNASIWNSKRRWK